MGIKNVFKVAAKHPNNLSKNYLLELIRKVALHFFIFFRK
jgi:hypothetical protein